MKLDNTKSLDLPEPRQKALICKYESANPYKETGLKSHFDRIGHYSFVSRYLLPSRIMVESAAVSLPSIFNLNTHRMLLDVLEEVLGLPEVSIIPQPIALVYGYHLRNPHLPLTGGLNLKHDKADRTSSAPMDFHSRLLDGQGKLYEMMKSNNCQHRL